MKRTPVARAASGAREETRVSRVKQTAAEIRVVIFLFDVVQRVSISHQPSGPHASMSVISDVTERVLALARVYDCTYVLSLIWAGGLTTYSCKRKKVL